MAGKNRRGFGSVRETSPGRFQARYSINGVSYRAPIMFTRRRDADEFLATVHADLVRGVLKAPRHTATTVGDYVKTWITQNGNLKATTRALYETLHRNHLEGTGLAGLALSDVLPDDIRSWMADLSSRLAREAAERGRQSTATRSDGSTAASQAYRLLRAAMRTAEADGLIQHSPCTLKPPKPQGSHLERPIASTTEVQALAEAMPKRYRALILLAAWTGARVGEISALRRRDLDLEAGTVQIVERAYALKGRIDFDTPKSAASVRTITLPPHLIPELEAHLEDFTGPGEDDLVFTTAGGRPAMKDALWGPWNRARTKVGRPDLRLHDLRHTGQTLAALAGATEAELMRRMGHSTTAASRVYMHAQEQHSRAVAEALSEIATGGDNVITLRPVHRRSRRGA